MASKLDDKVLTSIKLEYPFPLSFTYFSMKNTEEKKAKVDKALEVLESIVKYLTVISLSSSLRDPLTPELSNFILSWLPRPSLGTWNAALREILGAHHTKPEDLFLPEIYHFYYRSNKKPSDNARIIDNLISERNRLAHGGAPSTPRECEQWVEEIQPRVEELMFNLSFLRDYELMFLRYSRKEQDTFHHVVKVCMGAFSQFENKDISTESSENSNHMYLYHRERNSLLDLHPFLVYSDRFESAGAPEIFFYNRLQEHRVNYMNYQSGHSFNDAEIYAEMEKGILAKLNSYAMAKGLKFEEYRKMVLDAWRLGTISGEEEARLAAKKEELGISPEDALQIETDAKDELFERHIRDLIGLLDQDAQKDEAIRTISKAGTKAIPFVIGSLENQEIHGALIEILISFGEEAIDPLLKALGDDTMRMGAVKALKELSSLALPKLLQDLDRPEEVPEVEETLVFFGQDAVCPLVEILKAKEAKASDGGMKLVSLKEDRAWQRATRILTKIGKPSAQELVKYIADPLVGETSIRIITEIGAGSYDALVGILTDERLNKTAIRILREFGTSTIPRILEETAKYSALSEMAKEFVQSFGEEAVPELVHALKEGQCTELVLSLLRAYPAAYPELLVPLLPEPRLAATIETLLTEAGEFSIPHLIKALNDPMVTESAEKLLSRLPPKLVLPGILEEVRSRGKSLMSGLTIAGKIESGVRDVLKDLSKHKIFGTVMDTVKLKAESIEDTIRNIRDPFTKKSISLISMMPAAELAPLIESLEEDSLWEYLRIALMSAEEGIIPLLVTALKEKSEKVRERCSIILSDIGAPAIPYLTEVLGSEAAGAAAAKTLVSIGPAGAGEIAKALIDETTRESLKDILRQIGPPGFRYYAAFLGVPVIGEALEEIIIGMKNDIIPELIAQLSDMSSRENCITILKKMGDRAVPSLIEALKKDETAGPVIEVLINAGPSAIPQVFERYRQESSAVSGFIKGILSIGKKQEAVSSPAKRALIELSASYPGPLLEICSSPKSRDLSIPLIAEISLYLVTHESMEKRDENFARIRDYIRENTIGSTIKSHVESNRQYKSTDISKTLHLLEL